MASSFSSPFLDDGVIFRNFTTKASFRCDFFEKTSAIIFLMALTLHTQTKGLREELKNAAVSDQL